MNRIQTLLLVALVLFLGCDKSADRDSKELQRDIGTVALEINFGESKSSKSIDVVCSPDSTVLLSLERAQQMNKLKFESKGSGERTFVESIDGVGNEGAGGKNWIYRVNDKLGDKSAGVFEVAPGDKISWSWGAPPEELQ